MVLDLTSPQTPLRTAPLLEEDHLGALGDAHGEVEGHGTEDPRARSGGARGGPGPDPRSEG